MENWTIWANCPITRRKSFYLITDPEGEVVFRDRHLWPAIEYLAGEGVEVYDIKPSEVPRGAVVATLSIDRRQ